MNKAKLKSYAPQARRDFVAAVEARANLLGLSEKGGRLDVTASVKKGDVALIGGQAWPAKVHDQRERLIKRIRKDGYAQTLEAVAYTWFNRFAALRYMEIHDYLGHGYRVLSSREGGLPEVLTHATEVAGLLPGLNATQVAEMRLAGNKDGELYRLLLVAQCNALSNAMPFLFERIDDESELLLPGNLERTDSVIAKLVSTIDEEDWNEVEVIGWLYQFYISEKKDEVIGKVVKSEDIPAATQLFTPNWIVQYLVQNSVGRLWLMANPTSTLKSQWPYYVDAAEQTPEVQAQLDAPIQIRMAEDGSSLNPESITVLDPACGSGHILVQAYEVLKAIYLERGYQARAIPRLILEKNLYGLDIDDRAAQLAGFALMMKARADDRRLLDRPLKLNVHALQDSKGMDVDEFAGHLQASRISRTLLESLINTFEHAKTFGSLIQIPQGLSDGLKTLADDIETAMHSGDLLVQAVARDLVPLMTQATVLAMKFDAVVANPPYMGANGMNAALKSFAKEYFSDSKSDLYTMFIDRSFEWCKKSGLISMVTMHSWMFLSSYEVMRGKLLSNRTIVTMAHLGPRAFSEISGEVVQTTAFVLFGKSFGEFKPAFFRLVSGTEDMKKAALAAKENCHSSLRQKDLDLIPGRPIMYWVKPWVYSVFKQCSLLGDRAVKGLDTNGAIDRFLRRWHEISMVGDDPRKRKWFPLAKGGEFRKWYGNHEYVIDYESNGLRLRANKANLRNQDKYFREGLTWTVVTTSGFCVRYLPEGFLFDQGGSAIFSGSDDRLGWSDIAAALNSKIVREIAGDLCPTLNFTTGDVNRFPLVLDARASINAKEATEIAKSDWDCFESSWDFRDFYLTRERNRHEFLSKAWECWKEHALMQIARLKSLEEGNNRLFIEAYGLEGEFSPDVSDGEITLARADREKDCQRLISYAIGCMMGRYSLDEPGLIYANAGNVGFDATRYKTFSADADGIIPITDELWFEDDAANRVREFLIAVWSAPTLDENLVWLAESLGSRTSETPEETMRRYLSGSFFKDHLQTYKKRPIYWLFSSGKQGAFQALVYLHRYHEGTVARMRAEYVVPLTGKMQSRIEMLEKNRDAASSTTARNKIAKQIESLKKKHVELLAYDEKLRHYADMRITLDLDDGVKVNYGKFGDLLAEVKSVTGGGASDD